MECLLEWSNIYGIDPNNKAITQYRKAFNEITAKGISFPSQKIYFKDVNAQKQLLNQAQQVQQANQVQQTQQVQQVQQAQQTQQTQAINGNKTSQQNQSGQNEFMQKPNIANNDNKKGQSVNTGAEKNKGSLEKTINETLSVAEEYKEFLSQNLPADGRPDEDSIFRYIENI